MRMYHMTLLKVNFGDKTKNNKTYFLYIWLIYLTLLEIYFVNISFFINQFQFLILRENNIPKITYIVSIPKTIIIKKSILLNYLFSYFIYFNCDIIKMVVMFIEQFEITKYKSKMLRNWLIFCKVIFLVEFNS